MKLKTPMKQIYNNLMLTSTGDIWAYYRVMPEVIPPSNKEATEDSKARFRHMLENLVRYKDFHIEMYPRQMNLEKRFDAIERDFSDETRHIGEYYNNETVDILNSELGLVTTYDFVIGVRLKSQLLNESDDFKSVAKDAVVSVTDRIANWLGLDREVSDEFFQQFERLEEDLFEQMSILNVQKLPEDDLYYINRYNFLRQIHHSVEEEKEQRGMTNMTDCIIDPTEPGYLKLQADQGDCYLSFVVIDDFPLNMKGTHIFKHAQSMPFPVEAHVKAQFEPQQTSMRKVELAKQRLKETDKDRADAGEEVDDQEENYRDALQTGYQGLKSNQSHFIKWVATFVVYGQTKDECKSNANTIRRAMKDMEIYCVRPMADQLQLFYKFLHGTPLMFDRNWVQRTTETGFSENLFGVSDRLGSNVGFYFGRVCKSIGQMTLEQSVASSRDIVLFHPFIANEGIKGAVTDSPHISITGQTGKGKSFLVKLILIYLSFLNTRLLMTDPKNEIEYWFRKVADDPDFRVEYPYFVELINKFHYITFDSTDPENWGVLDPLCFLEASEARDTAESIIQQIYDLDGKDDVKTEVLKALSNVIEDRQRGQEVGLMHVVYRLQQNESKNVKDAGDLLYQMAQNSVLQLIFSDGHNKGVKLDHKISILQIEGLDLPKEDDDPNFYSDSERKSLCLMIPLAKFCEKFGSRDRNENTAIIFDEAWTLTNAKGGKKLIKQMRRIGRSYKNQLYLVTQSVNDLQDEDDRGNFGACFAFDESQERGDILSFVGLDDEENNHELLKNMMKGQCLFRDFYGRTAKLAVDCLFDEWKEAFKTVEKSHSAEAEEAF